MIFTLLDRDPIFWILSFYMITTVLNRFLRDSFFLFRLKIYLFWSKFRYLNSLTFSLLIITFSSRLFLSILN